MQSRNEPRELYRDFVRRLQDDRQLELDDYLSERTASLSRDDYEELRELVELHSTLAFDYYRGRLVGGYRLSEELGTGATGRVWSAEHVETGRSVAIKFIDPIATLASAGVERVERESLAASRLDHPNVVKVHGIGRAHSQYYIVQELVEGGRTLADLVDEHRSRDVGRDYYQFVAEAFRAIADGLAAIHREDILHRDLKPKNIFIEGRKPKIGDFGLAHIADEETVTARRSPIGTLPYTSPELLTHAEPASPRTEVYSLGASMYEALTFQRPFDGDSSEAILRAMDRSEPRHPRTLRAAVPDDLAAIALECIELDPRDRYQSIAGVRDDLDRWLAGEPVRARPPGRLQRTRRWMRRNPVAVRVGLVAAATIVLLASLLAWALRAEQRVSAANAAITQQNQTLVVERNFKQDLKQLLMDSFVDGVFELEPSAVAKPGFQAYLDRALERLRDLDTPGEAFEQDVADVEEYVIRAMLRGDRNDEGGRLMTDLLERRLGWYGDLHPKTGSALLWLAELEGMRGHFSQAEELFERAAAALTTAGEPGTHWVFTQFGLAKIWMKTGRRERAKTILAELARVIEGRLPALEPHLAHLEAQARFLPEDSESAAETYRQRVKWRLEREGYGQFVVDDLRELAVIYDEMQRPELAEPLLWLAWQDYDERWGAADPRTLERLVDLAQHYLNRGLTDVGLAVSSAARELVSDAHSPVLAARASLALLRGLHGRRRFSEAMQVRCDTHEWLGRIPRELWTQDTWRLWKDFGMECLGAGEFARAETAYLVAIEQSLVIENPERHWISLEGLAISLRAQDRSEEALARLEPLVFETELWDLEPSDRRVLLWKALAYLYQATGRHDDALTVWEMLREYCLEFGDEATEREACQGAKVAMASLGTSLQELPDCP